MLRALGTELRAKRLLPVVAVLIAALVAIPLVLAKPSPSADVPALPAVPGGTSPGAGVPALSQQQAPQTSNLPGPARDPFPQTSTTAGGGATATATATATTVTAAPNDASAAAPSTATTLTTTTATATTTSATATTTTTTTTTTPATTKTTTTSTTTTTPARTTPAVPSASSYAVDLAFGPAQRGSLRTYDDVERFVTFPSRWPAIVFLGVERDGRTAEFLLSPQASPAGDGSCSPSRTQCTFLAMKPGQTELVLFQTATAATSEYQLRYASVQVRQISRAASGSRRVSQAGRRIVHAAGYYLHELLKLRYARLTGLLLSKLKAPLINRALRSLSQHVSLKPLSGERR
jgi:hypothetical protein